MRLNVVVLKLGLDMGKEICLMGGVVVVVNMHIRTRTASHTLTVPHDCISITRDRFQVVVDIGGGSKERGGGDACHAILGSFSALTPNALARNGIDVETRET